MPSPRRQLLAAFETCLKRIKKADGYNTDAGNFVTLERGQEPASRGLLLAVVIARQDRANDPALPRTHRATTVGVVAKVAADLRNSDEVLDLIVEDIERAMRDTQRDFPAGIQYPQYAAMEPLPVEAGTGFTGAVVTYTSHIPIL